MKKAAGGCGFADTKLHCCAPHLFRPRLEITG